MCSKPVNSAAKRTFGAQTRFRNVIPHECYFETIITMDSNVESSLVLLVMPVSDLASFVIMMLVLVRECIRIWCCGRRAQLNRRYVKQGV